MLASTQATLDISGLKTTKPHADTSLVELSKVKDVFVHGNVAAQDTDTFLSIDDASSDQLTMESNQLKAAKTALKTSTVFSRLTALSPEEVTARHMGAEYVVGFLGFAPGFAYLLGVDERLHVERRAEPRQLVPAGSVALAGPYSGIYPRESPGGWQLIGSTTAVLFDATRDPPALLSAGDRVRFVPA